MQQRGTVLDLDSTRANTFPADYDTDLEYVWSNPSKIAFSYYRHIVPFCVCTALFANGDDFSWETIQKGRNAYYQRQMVRLPNLCITSFMLFMEIGKYNCCSNQ